MADKRGIYLPNGAFMPFSAAKKGGLGAHIATRERAEGYQWGHLPNPDPVLKRQGKDIAVYRDLLTDAHLGGCVRRRKAAVKAMEWRLDDSHTSGDARVTRQASAGAMALCHEVLGGLDFQNLLSQILDAPLFGYTPLEIMWGVVNKRLVPTSIDAKPQEWFVFSPDGELRFKTMYNQVEGEPLDYAKFLLPRQDASYANPYGRADLAMCFWPVTFKRGGLKFWAMFAEKYGSPFFVAKQGRNASDQETEDLLDALEGLQQAGVAALPNDASVEIVESSSKSDAAGAYERLLMACRSETAIAILGQNQSTEASSTHASAVAGLEVAKDLRDGDARIVESTINQLLEWVVAFNEGEGAAAPRFTLFEQSQVDTVLAERDLKLTQAGARLTNDYLARAYGFKKGDLAPQAADAGLRMPAQLPKPSGTDGGADGQMGPSFAEGKAPAAAPVDELDAYIAQQMTDLWALRGPQLGPLQAAFAEAEAKGETAGQLLARLPGLLEQMDSAALQKRLADAATVAQMMGQSGAIDVTTE